MNRVILPLDDLDTKEALDLAKELRDEVWGFKVNDLFVEEGLSIIKKLKDLGKVFVDSKLHDIPNTVSNSVKRISNAGADLITIHGSGGSKMIEAAISAKTGDTKILCVTILTSTNEETCSSIYGDTTINSISRIAKVAILAKTDGLVCSARECEEIRKIEKSINNNHNILLVTPGIRPSWYQNNSDDQARIETPKDAMQKGASLLVIGRPITGSKDPLNAIKLINSEINNQS